MTWKMDNDPGNGVPDPREGGDRTPKSQGGGVSNPAREKPTSIADQAVVLPIAYGTVKLPLLIIEKNAPINVQPPAWKPSTTYRIDDWVSNYGQAYKCIGFSSGVTGTSGSASGPVHSSGSVTEALGPTWQFLGAYKTWQEKTPYSTGDYLVHGGSAGTFQFLYQAQNNGVSERQTINGDSGPRGSDDYLDGTVQWQFVGIVTAWAPSTDYTSSSLSKVIPGHWVTNVGNVYVCTSGGKSSSTPSGPSGTTGANITSDGNIIWQWQQALPCYVYQQSFVGALCEGQATSLGKVWWDKERVTAGSRSLTFGAGPDAGGQTLPAAFESAGYQHTALVHTTGAVTGTQRELPDIAVEINAVQFGGGNADVNPADILTDVWTHTRRGCGLSSARLDASVGGAAASSWRTYCDAAGLRLSMVIDSQRTALSIIADLLLATNSDAVWSGGKLKVVPLADQPIASPVYGSTAYTPANVAEYNLGPNDFLDKRQPVQMTRRSDTDCFNAWPVQYYDRAADYAQLVHEDPDVADIDKRGKAKRASTTVLPVIFPDGTRAMQLSRTLAQRSLNIRNTYTFRVSWKYILVEPTTVLTLTEPSIGLVSVPVRVTEVRENADRTLTITADDYPAGVSAATGYQPQQGDGYKANEPATSSQGIPTQINSTTTGLGARSVGAPALQTGAVGAAQTSPGTANTDELWPNANSESAPPPGVDTSFPTYDGNTLKRGSAEWAGRTASATAYAGSYVRRVVADQEPSSGDFFGSFEHRIPCSPGQSFYLEAWARIGTGGLSLYAEVQLVFYGSDGSAVAFNYQDATSSSWTLISISATAPAGAVAVGLQLNAGDPGGGTGTGYAEFDNISARRMVGGTIIEAAAIKTGHLDAGVVTASKIATGTITANEIAAGTITADKLAVNSLRTNQYTETTETAWATSTAYTAGQIRYVAGSGNTYICTASGTSASSGTGPSGTGTSIVDGTGSLRWDFLYAGGYATAGAKLDNSGTALKVAANNLVLGQTNLSRTWFSRYVYCYGVIFLGAGSLTASMSNAASASIVGNAIRFTFQLPSGATPNIVDAFGWSSRKDSASGKYFEVASTGGSAGTVDVKYYDATGAEQSLAGLTASAKMVILLSFSSGQYL